MGSWVILSRSASNPVGTPISWTVIPLAPVFNQLKHEHVSRFAIACREMKMYIGQYVFSLFLQDLQVFFFIKIYNICALYSSNKGKQYSRNLFYFVPLDNFAIMYREVTFVAHCGDVLYPGLRRIMDHPLSLLQQSLPFSNKGSLACITGHVFLGHLRGPLTFIPFAELLAVKRHCLF